MKNAVEILLAEDEAPLRRQYAALFTSEGYAVRAVRNGAEAVRAFCEKCPDVVVLDVMMPLLSGVEVCQKMRRINPHVPILMLTALDDTGSEVRGLDAGADDYIRKTDAPAALLARLARAAARTRALDCAAPEDALQLGRVRVNFSRMTIGENRMTVSEALFLRCLAAHRGGVVTPREIFAALRGEGYVGDQTALRTLVLRLRRKLGPAANMVATSLGAGYYLVK